MGIADPVVWLTYLTIEEGGEVEDLDKLLVLRASTRRQLSPPLKLYSSRTSWSFIDNFKIRYLTD